MDFQPSHAISNSSMLWTLGILAWFLSGKNLTWTDLGAGGESTALSIKGWGMCAGGGGTAHKPAAKVTSSGEAPSWHLEKYEHCKTLSSKRFGGRICFFSICLRHNCPLAVWWNRAVLDSESEAFFFTVTTPVHFMPRPNTMQIHPVSKAIAPLSACSVLLPSFAAFMKKKMLAGAAAFIWLQTG